MFQIGYNPDYPWLSLILPGMVLGAFSLAAIARLTRTSLIENLRSDYVRTAKAKGLTTRRTIGIHTLRNSLIPVVTYIGIDIGLLLGGSIVTEGIFNVPGVGLLTFISDRAQRHPDHHRRGDDPGHRVPGRQPARRHPVRRTRPEDPL